MRVGLLWRREWDPPSAELPKLHRSFDAFRDEFPVRLAAGNPLVLKQHRGMGGDGVWKVELADAESVVVQHAAGGAAPEVVELADFLASCEPYFAHTGLMVEQPYQ